MQREQRLPWARMALLTILWTAVIAYAGAEITGYSCGAGRPAITTVSLREIRDCDFSRLQPKIEEVDIQLLQRSTTVSTLVNQCRVFVDKTIEKCGMFSHRLTMFQKSYVHELSEEACRNLNIYGQFKYNEQLLDKLQFNGTSYRHVILAGVERENGECKGALYNWDGHAYEEAVVKASLTITIAQFHAIADTVRNELVTPDGLKCVYKNQRCLDGERTQFFWSATTTSQCKFEEFTILYEGKAVKVTDGTSENKTVYFGNSSTHVQFGLEKTGQGLICGYKISLTEHPKLVIFEGPGSASFAKNHDLKPEDVLQDVYFNSKLTYLARHVGNQFGEMYKDILTQRCQLERRVLQDSLVQVYERPDIFADAVMREPGHMAYTAGEVAHIVKCGQVNCRVRKTDLCYDELPVTCGEMHGFLRPKTRIFVHMGTIKDCNRLLPTMFLLNGVWHTYPSVAAAFIKPQPLEPGTKPTWRYVDLESFMESGIYSERDLEEARHRLVFHIQRESIANELARKIAPRAHEGTSVEFGELMDEARLEGFVGNFMNKAWTDFQKFGIVCAGTIGVLMIFQLLKLIVDSIIRGIAIYKIYGFTIHILGALLGSLTHLLTTIKPAGRKEEQQQGDDVERAGIPMPLRRATTYRTLPSGAAERIQQQISRQSSVQ